MKPLSEMSDEELLQLLVDLREGSYRAKTVRAEVVEKARRGKGTTTKKASTDGKPRGSRKQESERMEALFGDLLEEEDTSGETLDEEAGNGRTDHTGGAMSIV